MILSTSNQTKLIGHDNSFLKLKTLFDNKKLPNKILFTGQKGIGKCTLAYHLSNYILSRNEDFYYNFNKYEINENNKTFKLINNNSHPNFYLINLKDDKKNIEISQIRGMISYTNKSSFDNDYKIIIIDNVESLNLNSVNALLKVVEEPNDKVIFFLIHNSQKNIIETLKSRCIQFKISLNTHTNKKILDTLLGESFYNDLNSDFKNYYNTPGQYIELNNYILNNNVDYKNITIEEFLKRIIKDGSFKKDDYIKNNIINFIELFFVKKLKNINSKNINSKNKIFYIYNYFMNKIDKVKKYNLDIETFLIEFNSKLING